MPSYGFSTLLVIYLLFTTAATGLPTDVPVEHLVKRAGQCSATYKNRLQAGERGIERNIRLIGHEKSDLRKIEKLDPGLGNNQQLGNNNRQKSYNGGQNSGQGYRNQNQGQGSRRNHRRDTDPESVVDTVHPAAGAAELHPRAQDYRGFNQAKGDLQQTYNKAVDQRKSNERTLPSSSGAYSKVKEYGQKQDKAGPVVYGLDGSTRDRGRVQKLEKGFAGGLKLNEQALQRAESQCKRDLERVQWIEENMPHLMAM